MNSFASRCSFCASALPRFSFFSLSVLGLLLLATSVAPAQTTYNSWSNVWTDSSGTFTPGAGWTFAQFSSGGNVNSGQVSGFGLAEPLAVGQVLLVRLGGQDAAGPRTGIVTGGRIGITLGSGTDIYNGATALERATNNAMARIDFLGGGSNVRVNGTESTAMPNFANFKSGQFYQIQVLSQNEFTVLWGSGTNVTSGGLNMQSFAQTGQQIQKIEFYNLGANMDSLLSNVVVFNNPTLNFSNASGSNNTITGVISNNGSTVNSVVKNGAGTVTLSVSNSYTGTTTINDGTLRAGHNSAFGTNSVVLNAGTIASDSSTARTFANALTIGGNVTFGQTSGGTGTLNFSSSSTNDLGGGTRTLTANVATTLGGAIGNGNLTKEGSANLILSNAGSSFGTLTINAGSVVLTNNAAITGLAGSSGLVLGNGTLSVNNTSDQTFNGAVTGSGNLTKQGAGVLNLSNASSSFGTLTVAAGSVALNANATVTGLAGSGGLAVNATLTVTNATEQNFGGAVSGTGGFLKAGAGTLVLGGNSSYSGTTDISNGVVTISHANALGSTAGSTTVRSGAALQLSNGITTAAEALTLNGSGVSSGGALRNLSGDNTYSGDITLGSSSRISSDTGTLTLNGAISGTGQDLTVAGAGNVTLAAGLNTSTGARLTKDDGGVLTLSASNNYTVGTTVNGGTIRAGHNSSFGGGGITLANGTTISSDSASARSIANALTINGNITFGQTTGGTGALAFTTAGSISLGATTRTWTFHADTLLGGQLGTGSLTKEGNATLSLSNASSSFSTLTVNGGSVAVLTNATITGLAGSGGLALGGGVLTVNNTSDQTFTGAISGSGNLTKQGAGALNLSNAANSLGTLTISAGSVTLNTNAAVTGLGGSGGLVLSGGVLTVNAGSDQTFTGAVTGSGNLTKQGAGVLNLSNASSSFGTLTVSAGSVAFSTNATVTGLSGSGGLNVAGGTFTVNNASTASFGGAVSGAGVLAKSGDGVLTLTGSAAHSGGTAINAGTLAVGNGGTTGSISGNITNNASLVFNRSDAVTNNSAISGSGSVVVDGGSTLTLAGSSTYAGTTTVTNASTLNVAGSLASSVNVHSGSTVTGSGTVGGLTIQDGGTINPGNSPGTFNITGDVDWLGGGNYNWQIYNATGTAGTGWDLISASGQLDLTALTVSSRFNINLWSLSAVTPDVNGDAINFDNTITNTWTILSAAGGITGFSADLFNINVGPINGTAGFANNLGGGSFLILQSGNNLQLQFTPGGAPIPEPGTYAVGLLLLSGTGWILWRRRRQAAPAA